MNEGSDSTRSQNLTARLRFHPSFLKPDGTLRLELRFVASSQVWERGERSASISCVWSHSCKAEPRLFYSGGFNFRTQTHVSPGHRCRRAFTLKGNFLPLTSKTYRSSKDASAGERPPFLCALMSSPPIGPNKLVLSRCSFSTGNSNPRREPVVMATLEKTVTMHKRGRWGCWRGNRREG